MAIKNLDGSNENTSSLPPFQFHCVAHAYLVGHKSYILQGVLWNIKYLSFIRAPALDPQFDPWSPVSGCRPK